jgi:hypothetical protein
VTSNSLATTHPELAKEWHPTKNGSLTPKDVIAGSHKSVWWICDKGPDHEYKAIIKNRVMGHGCSVCAGMTVVVSNCLATTHPKIADEWHPTKNGNLTPDDVIAGTHRRVWWQCKNNPGHIWKTAVVHRARGRGCPYCFLAPQSKEELTILFELKYIFPGINPQGHKLAVKGKLNSVDIYIPELKIVIEYDGSYWHKNRYDTDIQKSKEILSQGIKLIRVREHPLPSILANDIIVNQPFAPKAIIDRLLLAIQNMVILSEQTINQIQNYTRKKDLQNEEEMHRYVNKILKNKAKKFQIKTDSNHDHS